MFDKFKKKAIEKAAMKMIKEDFTLDDFLNQLNKLGKIGNLSKVMPGLGGTASKMAMSQINDKFIDKCKLIIEAMNEDERRDPKSISSERKKSIATEANVNVEEVDGLIKQFEQAKKNQPFLAIKFNNDPYLAKQVELLGKYKELLAEQSSTIDNLNAKLESQTGIVSNYKQNLINGLTSDEDRKEHLATKSVDFLEELNKEKALIQPETVSNPKESLGAVRKTVSNKSFSDMTEAEKTERQKQMTQN